MTPYCFIDGMLDDALTAFKLRRVGDAEEGVTIVVVRVSPRGYSRTDLCGERDQFRSP